MDFPRTVFKTGGKLIWGKNKKYSSLMVNDMDSCDKALKDGYVLDLNDAIFPKEIKENDTPSWRELAIECGLEGEELKAFMKKNTANKQKQLEKMKG